MADTKMTKASAASRFEQPNPSNNKMEIMLYIYFLWIFLMMSITFVENEFEIS